MKRSIIILHNDETPDIDLELGKAAAVNVSDKEFVYFEKMDDGKWRLTYTTSTIPDFSKVDGFRVLREDDLEFHNVREEDGGLRMQVSGEPAMTFMTLLIELFEQNGGKNFLTLTIESKDKTKRYAIEIKNLNGDLSVAQKLQQQEDEIARLKARLHDAGIDEA